jgi:hypothetical protein
MIKASVRPGSAPTTAARSRKVSAGRWRLRAEVLSALSEEISDPAVRAMMLGIAANYTRRGQGGVPDASGRLIRTGLRYVARARESIVAEGA